MFRRNRPSDIVFADDKNRPQDSVGPKKSRHRRRWFWLAILICVLGACIMVKITFNWVFPKFVAGDFDYDVAGKVMVVYPQHDLPWQGMVSDMIGAVGALHYAEEHGAIGVRFFMDTVDYIDTAKGPNYWDYFFQSSTYLMRSGAASDTFEDEVFHSTTGTDVADKIKHVPEVHFNGYLARFGAFGSWTQVSIGHRSRELPFPLDNADCADKCGISFGRMQQLVSKYFHLKPEFSKQVESVWADNMRSGSFVVGAHYRGTDKKLIWPYATPTYSKFADEVQNAASKAGKAHDFQVFLATDEEEVVKYFTHRFGEGNVTFVKNAPRLSAKDAFATEEGTHKSTAFTSYQKGSTAILDIWLLSKCDYVVKGRSSLSDLALLVGDLEFQHSFYLSDSLVYTKTAKSGYASHSMGQLN